MIKPTIHRNGTSQQELLDQVCGAIGSIRDAMEALAKATPNGRDYYVQDDPVTQPFGVAIKIALEEHNSRATRLQSVRDELQELALYISDQEPKKYVDQERQQHPFVGTPERRKCSSCGMSRYNTVHFRKGEI